MRRVLGLALIAASIAACALEVVGVEGAVGGGDDASASSDASFEASPLVDSSTPDGNVDAGCVIAVDDPLTGPLDPRWYVVSNNANFGYPRTDIDITTGGPPMLALLGMNVQSGRGGIWLKSAMPLEAFDIDVDFRVLCNNAICGDGFAAAWLNATTRSALDTGDVGGVLGIPAGVRGGAVEVDLFQNEQQGDEGPPALSLLKILAAAKPGSYDWVDTSWSMPQLTATRGLQHLAFQVRQGKIALALGGTSLPTVTLTWNTITTLKTGMFGFTATTGADTVRIFLANFRGRFYPCNPPPFQR